MASNPFMIDVGNPLQGLGQMAQAWGQKNAAAEAATAAAKATTEKQKEITDLIGRGDVAEMSQYMAANPQMAKGIESAFNFKSGETKSNMADGALRIISGEDPQEVIRDRAAFVSQMGGDPSHTLDALNDSPEELMQSAKVMLAQFGTPEQIKAATDLGIIASADKGMTPYQVARLDLDAKGLKLRELETKLRSEDNANKSKSLDNRVKKERLNLDKMERELAADQKGGEAQKMLRDATESSKAASSFARRMTTAGSALDKIEETIDPTSRVIGYIAGGTGITSEAANRMASPEEQAYATAASDFVTSQLRDESGASIGTDEFDRKYREFFPMPGDSKDQINLKRERRNAASGDMRNLSGGLYDALYGADAKAAQAQTAPQGNVVDWSSL